MFYCNRWLINYTTTNNQNLHMHFNNLGAHMTSWQLLRLTGILFIMITTSLTLYIQADVIGIDEDYIPTVFYILIIYLILCRQHIIFFKARMFFWRTVGKILFPHHPVAFGEVFIADIFTTLSKVFAEVEVMVCVIIAHFFSGNDHDRQKEIPGCMHSIFMPLVASLPYLWRARQCSVSYNATGEVMPHLVNLGKYLSAFPVIWTSFFKNYYASSPLYEEHLKNLWLGFVVINSIYSFIWDVYMDWGLGNLRCYFLRHELIFKYRIVYYLIILFDFFARFTWSVSLSQHVHMTFQESMWFFELIEVFRRFLWIFLRVEWYMLKSSERESTRIEDIEMPFRKGSNEF